MRKRIRLKKWLSWSLFLLILGIPALLAVRWLTEPTGLQAALQDIERAGLSIDPASIKPPTELTAANNARDLYLKAYSLAGTHEEVREVQAYLARGSVPKTRVVSLLKAWEPSLSTAALAHEKPLLWFDRDYRLRTNTPFPEYQAHAKVARMMALGAWFKSRNGEPFEAAEDLRRALAIAGHLRDEPHLFPVNVLYKLTSEILTVAASVALENYANPAVLHKLRTLKPVELHPITYYLRGEFVLAWGTFEFLCDSIVDEPPDAEMWLRARTNPRRTREEEMVRQIRSYLDGYRIAQEPDLYVARERLAKRKERTEGENSKPTIMSFIGPEAVDPFLKYETSYRLFRCHVAVAEFRQGHGVWPEKLPTTGLLARDALSGQPFSYSLKGGEVQIRAAGANGRHDSASSRAIHPDDVTLDVNMTGKLSP